jgi:P-type E1-E2 ATPase
VIEVDIPGWKQLRLTTLVLDVNGVIARDGQLLNEAGRRVAELRDRIEVHLLSADTHGRLDSIATQLNVTANRVRAGDEAEQKAAYVRRLGSSGVVAIGNGMNDVGMLKEAALAIAVMDQEGLAVPAMIASQIVTDSVYEALDMLKHTTRLIATLRR